MRAAEEVNNHDGSQNIAVLAAYEAAIGPALRAMVGIGLQSPAKVNEPKKRSRLPTNKKKDSDSRDHSKGHGAAHGTLAQASGNKPNLRESSARIVADHESNGPQRVNPDPERLTSPLRTDQGRETPSLDSDAFLKKERQALRRRKVEALESLAHTAALFLAEFMDFRQGRQDPPATTSPPPEPQQHQDDPGAGEAYAAAAAAGIAASLFRPLSEEIDRAGYNSSGSEMEQLSSRYDSNDDDDGPGKIPGEPEGGMDMDNRESHGTPSDPLASLRNGADADASEPGVKVEEH
ncbi:hypothetical protein INS49_011371 [Diaporthe citri]|uniref:uncharacterized protein n=1 Tax=Diaporthe citri TaxID=83186 RepID=UPI001C7EAD95|nr:uncharacterized protein INS49_011371 [Diaporthe citri]KAG6360314.1 hypothetical protein INS49_011371 [Diaporthe citri]